MKRENTALSRAVKRFALGLVAAGVVIPVLAAAPVAEWYGNFDTTDHGGGWTFGANGNTSDANGVTITANKPAVIKTTSDVKSTVTVVVGYKGPTSTTSGTIVSFCTDGASSNNRQNLSLTNGRMTMGWTTNYKYAETRSIQPDDGKLHFAVLSYSGNATTGTTCWLDDGARADSTGLGSSTAYYIKDIALGAIRSPANALSNAEFKYVAIYDSYFDNAAAAAALARAKAAANGSSSITATAGGAALPASDADKSVTVTGEAGGVLTVAESVSLGALTTAGEAVTIKPAQGACISAGAVDATAAAITVDLTDWDFKALAWNAVAGAPYRVWPLKSGTMAGTVTLDTTGAELPTGYTLTTISTILGPAIEISTSLQLGGSLSVNFWKDDDGKVGSSSSTYGAFPIAGTSWNDISGNSAGTEQSLSKYIAAGGAAKADGSAKVTTAGVANAWHCNSLGIYKQYIDDVSTPTVTIANIPFAKYRVIVYVATDSSSLSFSTKSINGVYYSTAAAGSTATPSLPGLGGLWGASDYRDGALEGVSYLASDVISDTTTVSIGNMVRDTSIYRSCIAAVQIVEVGVEKEVVAAELKLAANAEITFPGGSEWTIGGTAGQALASISDATAATITLAGDAKIIMPSSVTAAIADNLTLLDVKLADGVSSATLTIEYGATGDLPENSAMTAAWTKDAPSGLVEFSAASGVTLKEAIASSSIDTAAYAYAVDGDNVYVAKRPETGVVSVRIGARTQAASGGYIAPSYSSVGPYPLSGVLWEQTKFWNDNSTSGTYTDVQELSDVSGAAAENPIRIAYYGHNTYYNNNATDANEAKNNVNSPNKVLTYTYLDDSDSGNGVLTATSSSDSSDTRTLPSPGHSRGWQLHFENIPYNAYDVYFITASDVSAGTLKECPIYVSLDGGTNWKGYYGDTSSGKTAIGFSNWTGLPFAQDGNLVEGKNYLKMRISKSLYGDNIQTLEITHGTRDTGNSIRSGLAAIQIVEVQNDGVYTLENAGNWSDAIWTVGSTTRQNWTDTVDGEASTAKIAASETISSVTVNTAVSAGSVLLTGTSDFALNGTATLTVSDSFDATEFTGALTLNAPVSGPIYLADNATVEFAGDRTLAYSLNGETATTKITSGEVVAAGSLNTNIEVEDGAKLKLGAVGGFGSTGSGAYASGKTITAKAGGTIELNGIEGVNEYTLAGGTLQNTGNAIGNSSRQTSKLTLSADSTVHAGSNFGLLAHDYGSTVLTLAGNKLTKTGGNSFILCNVTSDANGSIEVAAGNLWFTRTGSTLNVPVTLGNGTTATIDIASTVKSFAGSGTVNGSAALTTTGLDLTGGLTVAAPVTLANGATVKLGAGSISSAITVPASATITVDFSGVSSPVAGVVLSNITLGEDAVINCTGIPNGFRAALSGDSVVLVDNRTATWTNAAESDSNWGTASNWSTGYVPDQYTTVTFPEEGMPEGGWTVGLTSNTGTDKCSGMVAAGDVTFNRGGSDWAYVALYGNVSGEGSMTLDRVGFSLSADSIVFAAPLTTVAESNDSFFSGYDKSVAFTKAVTISAGEFKMENVHATFTGLVAINDGAYALSYGEKAEFIFNGGINVPDGAAASLRPHATYQGAYTIASAVTLGSGSTLAVTTAKTTVTGATWISRVPGYEVGSMVDGATTTYALVAAGLDPSSGTLSGDVAFANEGDLTGDELTQAVVAAASITPPAGANVEESVYKTYFTYSATEKEAGVWTLEITGLDASAVVTPVDQSALDALVAGTAGGTATVSVKPGLYYGFTPGTTTKLDDPATLTLATGETMEYNIPSGDNALVAVKVVIRATAE